MAKVYLGLGSNLGDRKKNIEDAINKLETRQMTITKKSGIIETEPQGGPPQGKFLNAVIEAHTPLSPKELLNQTQKIERELGRVKTAMNGPRTIDIDILLYDDLAMNDPELTIPHPRMMKRGFVLTPLQQIAPNLKLFSIK